MNEFELVYRNGVWGYWVEGGLRFMPAIAGADGASDGDADPNDDDDDDDNTGNRKDEDDDDDDDNDRTRDPEARFRAEQQKSDRLAKRRNEEKKRADDLAAELKKLQDRDKSDLDKATGRVTEIEAERDAAIARALKAEREVLVLQHDDLKGLSKRRQRMVMKAIEDELEMEEDGSSNLDDLISDLKKEEPDFFKIQAPKDDDDDDDDEKDVKDKKPPKSGTQPTKKKDKGGLDQAQLDERFPALKRKRDGY